MIINTETMEPQSAYKLIAAGAVAKAWAVVPGRLTDFCQDTSRPSPGFDLPVLIVHGTVDQSSDRGKRLEVRPAAARATCVEMVVAPDGMLWTHAKEVNAAPRPSSPSDEPQSETRGRIMSTYRAFEVTGIREFSLVEREFVEPPPGELRLRVDSCQVCHSDALAVEGRRANPSQPIVPGHELVGVIDAVGAGVTAWRADERVGVGYLGGRTTNVISAAGATSSAAPANPGPAPPSTAGMPSTPLPGPAGWSVSRTGSARSRPRPCCAPA